MKRKWKILFGIKILLGLVFIASAVLKLCELDLFELYIYSYHFLSLNLSFLVARVVIIAELVFGIGLVSNTLHKFYCWGSMAMLLGYTLLLMYAIFSGRTDSCHCFGDYLQLNPKQSLLKNIALMLLLLPVYQVRGWGSSFGWRFFSLALIVSGVIVITVSPPDNFTSAYNSEANMNEENFQSLISDPPLDTFNLNEGKQVVCFFSTGCENCQMAAQKLSLMQQYYGFPVECITCVFMGVEENISEFYAKAHAPEYRFVLYPDVVRMVKAIRGQFPTVVLVGNGSVVETYAFRDMKEAEIKAFFTQP